jgi:hypothetical protein
MRHILLSLLFLFVAPYAFAENLTLTTYYPSPSGDYQNLSVHGDMAVGTIRPQSSLEVKSTTGAFIPPRMTTLQKTSMTPVTGGVVYDTTLNKLQYYNGSAWVAASGGSGGITGGCSVSNDGVGHCQIQKKWGNGCQPIGTYGEPLYCEFSNAPGYVCGEVGEYIFSGGNMFVCACIAN